MMKYTTETANGFWLDISWPSRVYECRIWNRFCARYRRAGGCYASTVEA